MRGFDPKDIETLIAAHDKQQPQETLVQCARCGEWCTAEDPCCPNSPVIHEGDLVMPERLRKDWRGGEA